MLEKILLRMRCGCQGWNYTDWVTPPGAPHVFYPRGTRQKEMLGLYSSVFDSVEVDSTFYACPSENTFESWRERSADGFVFSLKMPREVTHDRGLGPDSYRPADEFITRAALLGEKLGLILIQLPPLFKATRVNAVSLRDFIRRLPRDIRFSIEFRDREWLTEWTFKELSRNDVSICLVEGEWIPRQDFFEALGKITAGHLYVRFMGERDLNSFDRVCRPRESIIREWYERLTAEGRDGAFVYFSNLFEGFAPASVNTLRVMAGLGVSDPERLDPQPGLF